MKESNLKSTEQKTNKKDVGFRQALYPLAFLFSLIILGLLIMPNWLGMKKIPLEIIFILSSTFAAAQLNYLGFSWKEILESGTKKITSVLPTIFILLLIGMLIGSWMVSGCIPLFVYYGIQIIDPNYIYFLAFLLPVVFSTLTGTSIGSVGTIGIVVISIATVVGAQLPIVAGAIIGGAFFGDKLSPLSDTTNMAAIATDVDLYDHIGSMMYTTIPSALIAGVFYFFIGFIYPVETIYGQGQMDTSIATFLSGSFNFNLLILLPVVIIVIGSLRKVPAIAVLIASSLSACVLAIIFQDFGLSDVFQSIYKGFDTNMISGNLNGQESGNLIMQTESFNKLINSLLNRGGLYMLIDAVVIALLVFLFIGMLDLIKAIPTVINKTFSFAKSKVSVMLSSLFSTGIASALTNNQYAVSFIIGEAFKKKYDDLKIDRRVLSRSIEDYGTILENLIPWSPISITIVSILGVGYLEYLPWQIFSLANIVIAPLIIILGIGMFKKKSN